MMIGSKFGYWTVLEDLGKDCKSHHIYKCRCDCGFERNNRKSSLLNGSSSKCKSCASCQLPRVSKNIVGSIFSDWTIIGTHETKRSYVFCRCKCGKERLMWLSILERKLSKSCNDCRDERYRVGHGKESNSVTHGQSKTNTYKIWSGLISRCENPKVKIYKYYGGRGIKICDEWRNDFMKFLEDMGERPKGLQLDRIDNNLGYSKDNCRWATSKENNPSNKGDLPDDMPGKIFGKWLVLELVKHKPGHRYYKCICACGTQYVRPGGDLRGGKTTQCKSCAHKEHGSKHAGWNKRKNS